MSKALSDALATLIPDIPEKLRHLIGFETVNPPGNNYDGITSHLCAALNDVGVKARVLTPPAKLQQALLPADQQAFRRHNVLGLLKVPGAKRTLHFNAHFDVVPAGPGWKHGSAFSGAVEKGWIYGRGTADMKGSIISLLTALEALQLAGQKPSCNVEVSFTADEETDSMLGAGWLVSHAPLQADAVVVLEGGERDHVCCGHNGVVWLEVDVLGKAAHGSRPEQGVNALEKCSALILALEDYKKALACKTFEAPDGTVMHPTINLGGVVSQGAGGKINTVPDRLSFSIDRRVIPNETAAGVEKELRAALKKAAASIPGCRIAIRPVSVSFPCPPKPGSDLYPTMLECIQKVRRKPAHLSVSTGFTDMQFFAQHLKVPVLGYGPGGEGEHAVDERARLSDLADCARIYAELMTKF